jgi:hypothetical protein
MSTVALTTEDGVTRAVPLTSSGVVDFLYESHRGRYTADPVRATTSPEDLAALLAFLESGRLLRHEKAGDGVLLPFRRGAVHIASP